MPPIAIGAAIGAGIGGAAGATGLALAGAAVAGAGTGFLISQQQDAQQEALQRGEDFAREQQATNQAEQRRIEEKFGLEPESLAELERRADTPGEELLREVGPNTRRLLDTVAERQGLTTEELFTRDGGRSAELLLEEINKEGPLESFAPELELVLDRVSAEANRRGVFGGLPEGGIRFENLGRAGVDLAIAGARERLDRRTQLASTLFNIGAGARQEAGTVSESALRESERARDELLRGRQFDAGVATNALSATQPGVNQAFQNLQDIEGFKVGQAAKTQADITQGLASLGGIALEQSEFFKPPKPTGKLPPPVPPEDIDPYETLSLRTRGVSSEPKGFF